MVDTGDKFEKLRERAERLVKQTGLSHEKDFKMPEMMRLLHELEVHQMELELQHRELEEANKELEKSRQGFQALFEKAPIGYLVTNHEGIIRRANLTASNMLQIERATLEDDYSLIELVHEDDKDTYYRYRQQAIQTDTDQQCRIKLMRPDGEMLLVDLRQRRVDDTTLHITLVDVTEIHEADIARQEADSRQKKMDKLKRRMIRTLGHELRTPLSAILLSGQMLKRYNGGLSDIQLKRLDKIMYNTHHLMDIIQEVVASNPYDITVEAEDPEHIDMTAFIPHMINAVTDGERIQHTLDIQSGSQTVYWDRNNLERLMGHLLMNALKYSEDDVLLTVELQSNEMVIRLEDSGMGIPDEAKDHIFELFYRAENVETISGIGLGLNIAKRVVNLHDGKIDIESTLDEGTTVTVTLPRYLMKQR